eukprot:3012711-Amphidinium_carterae.1
MAVHYCPTHTIFHLLPETLPNPCFDKGKQQDLHTQMGSNRHGLRRRFKGTIWTSATDVAHTASASGNDNPDQHPKVKNARTP